LSYVNITDVTKKFGNAEVLKGISFEAERGNFVSLVGPSRCGKPTLLRLVAGLDPLTSGSIAFDGRCMNEAPAGRRDAAFVFQSYALYPHMTGREHLGFSLSCGGHLPPTLKSAFAPRRPHLEDGTAQDVGAGPAIGTEIICGVRLHVRLNDQG
jgi:ABC-type sugar transport system ATPase subunit